MHTVKLWNRAAALAAALCAVAYQAGASPLWTIGTRDRDTREFALAPDGYKAFKDDGFFVAGRSKPRRDWPYIQPGPQDTWAGSRRHTFTVAFGVGPVTGKAEAALKVFLVDTHPTAPPVLRIRVNGEIFERPTQKGSGEDTYTGKVSGAPPSVVEVRFPTSLLHPGDNRVDITTVSGSWILYDAVELDAPGVTPAPSARTHVAWVRADRALLRGPHGPVQPIHVEIRHFGKPETARFFAGSQKRRVELKEGATGLDLEMPPVKRETEYALRLEGADGRTLWTAQVTLKPVRPWTVYLLPHSHNDIGYTAPQSEVLKKQMRNLEEAIALARRTQDYPEGSRFKWNSEGLWAVDAYLRQATPEQKTALRDAIRHGWVELQALYANELTALCRPEELVRLVQPAIRIARETGKPIPTAMITDVPGYTWGIVPVLAQAGVRYFSAGPNAGDRIGFTAKAWADKPFYWKSPSGREKMLFWMTGTSYSWFHGGTLAQKSDGEMLDYLDRLADGGYPYDMVQVRYTTGGDNGPPDETLPDTVKAWNERYASPRLVLATATEMFEAFEKRYGEELPTESGDFTPYWEDGAASSARETAENRASAERLSQAGVLWAILNPPAKFPAADDNAAWRDVVLYSEHTWGAYNSISEPDSAFVKGQWSVKKAFADDASRASRQILSSALASRAAPVADSVDVFDTSSWDRTDLVTIPAALSAAGDRVLGPDGLPVPSQRLKSGELAFLATGVPALGGRRYRITAGNPPPGIARATRNGLSAGGLHVAVDPETGVITRLESAGRNLAKSLNQYLYVPGRDPRDAETSGPATIRVVENGPLVASLEVRSAAPGTEGLTRVIRVVDGLDRVEVANTVDKTPVRAKEGVHFRFDFDVPQGQVRMETPWAVVRPEVDQLPGACKNWFTVQRWVDVSNENVGVTVAPLDAPLIEIGGITAETPWLSHIAPSQTILSYVMNNYWHTNYKAEQGGAVTFRYAFRPHGAFDALKAARFGQDVSRPLLGVAARGEAPSASWLRVEPSTVNVETLRPSLDGSGWIARLYGASGQPRRVTLASGDGRPLEVYETDLHERPGRRMTGPISVAAWDMVSLYIRR